MKLAEVSVKRPVFAIMMTAALIVLGACLVRVARPRPDAEDRRAGRHRCRSTCPGASAEEIETQITKRIEEAVNTISGIDELRAILGPGQLARHHHLHARARHRVGDAGRPRQGGARSSTSSRATRGRCRSPKMDPDAQPILSFAVYGPRVAEGADRDRRQAHQAGARDASRTSARSATTASASARSSCC